MTGVRSAANLAERSQGSSASGDKAASLRPVGDGGYGRSSVTLQLRSPMSERFTHRATSSSSRASQ